MFTAETLGPVLGAVGTADSATNFFSSGIGAMIQNVFIVIGIIIVLVMLVRSLGAFSKGKMGDLAKNIIMGLIAAVLCFNLALPFSLISGLTSLVTELFNTIGGFFGPS